MLKKEKYIFNTETLKFEKVRITFKSIIIKVFLYIIFCTFIGAISIIVFNIYFDSPKERILKRELQLVKLKFEELNSKIKEIENVLKDLQYRDENLYRTFFEMEPIPNEIRESGIGGALDFEEYKNISFSQLVIETMQKIQKLQNLLYVQTKSFDEIIELAINKEKWLQSIPAIIPIHPKYNYKIVSHYGWRFDPIFKGLLEFHEGIDFTCNVGTPIYATGNGKVIVAEYNYTGYGNQVIIDHGFNYKTRYAHLSKIKVRVGQEVKRGEIIGYSGNTGKSIGPHLHYEVIKNNKAVNPIHYFFLDLTPEQYNELIKQSIQGGGISLD